MNIVEIATRHTNWDSRPLHSTHRNDNGLHKLSSTLVTRYAPQNWYSWLPAIALAILLASPASAETVYVTDVLRLGIHADKSLDSPITTLVQSGTPLEVLAREENLVQVKSPGGTVGWVDGSLVQTEASTRSTVETLRRQLEEVRKSETSLKAEMQVLSERMERAERQRLVAESAHTELQGQLDKQQNDTATGASAEVAARETQLRQQLSEALREVETLAGENQRMQKLLETQALAAQQPPVDTKLASPSATSTPQDPGLMNVLNWALWQQILLISGCVLAFSLGAYIVDWNARRRHGGFRI